jgi:PAS domain-containing protein
VARGASFLARLPDAIDGAVAKRQAGAGSADAAEGPKPLRIAYAGDIQFLKGALGADRSQLQVTPIAEVLAEAATRRVSLDAVVIDHGARDAGAPTALADVAAGSTSRWSCWSIRKRTSALRSFDGSMEVPGEHRAGRIACRCGCRHLHALHGGAGARNRGARKRLRTLVDRLPACVVRASPDGAILAMNAVALDLVGAADPIRSAQGVSGAGRASTSKAAPTSSAAWRANALDGFSLTTLTGTGRTVEATAVRCRPRRAARLGLDGAARHRRTRAARSRARAGPSRSSSSTRSRSA